MHLENPFLSPFRFIVTTPSLWTQLEFIVLCIPTFPNLKSNLNLQHQYAATSATHNNGCDSNQIDIKEKEDIYNKTFSVGL